MGHDLPVTDLRTAVRYAEVRRKGWRKERWEEGRKERKEGRGEGREEGEGSKEGRKEEGELFM